MRRTSCGSWATAFLLLIALSAFPALAQPQEGAVGDAQIRVYDRGLESQGKAFLRVSLPEDGDATRPIVFVGEILSPTDHESLNALLEIWDAAGNRVAEMTMRTRVAPGSTPLRLEWNASRVDDGFYHGSISLYRVSPDNPLAAQRFLAAKRSRENVEQMIERADAALLELRSHLETSLADDSAATTLVGGRAAVFGDALQEAKGATASRFDSYELASYVRKSVENMSARWALGGATQAQAATATLARPEHFVVDNAQFTSHGRPLFLAGLTARAEPADIERVGRYGLGLAMVKDSPETDLADWTQVARELDRSAGNNGVTLVQVLSQEERSPEDLVARARPVARLESFRGLALSGRPTIDIASPELRKAFSEEVATRYKDRYELNHAWRKRLSSLDEIDIWPDYDRRAYQYDWQTFLRGTLLARVQQNVQALHQALPNTPVMLTITSDVLAPGETKHGLDREALFGLAQIATLSSSESPYDPKFAMAYPNQSLRYSIQRTIAPSTPLIARHHFDLRGWEGCDFSPYASAFVWDSAIDGVAALILDTAPESGRPVVEGAAPYQALDGFLAATHEVNRLAGIIDAFRTASAPVAILWSESSRILDDGEEHLSSVRRAFEGTSFGGHKLRFVTETQLARGETEGIRLLVIPETLALSHAAFLRVQSLIDSGLPIIRAISFIPYDSWGRSQVDVLSFGPKTGLVRGNDASSEYMEAMDEALSRGRLPAVPRAVNKFGFPIEGVKTRYVEHGGESFLYVINFRKTPVAGRFTGGVRGGEDLIRGREITFPRMLVPLEPMLLRLDSSPALQARVGS